MTEETIPNFLLKTAEPAVAIVRVPPAAAELGAMLLAAIDSVTKPLVDRITELEILVAGLSANFDNFESETEDRMEKMIESALDELEVEVSAELKTSDYGARFR